MKKLSDSIHEVHEKILETQRNLEIASTDPATVTSANLSLESSSETVKKLDALVESIKALEIELKEAQFDYYRTVADMLFNVKEQMATFDAYGAIPHVILIGSKLKAIEKELQNHIQWSCREIGPLVSSDSDNAGSAGSSESSIDLQSLSQLYLVIDVLGVPFRKDLLERFAQLQLIPYEKIFKFGSKLAGIEYLDRRYIWFKSLLKAVNDKVSSIFPSYWNLPYFLFLEFSRRTSKHLAEVLEHAESNHIESKTYVPLLKNSLRSILGFEAEMMVAVDMKPRIHENLAEDAAVVENDDCIAPESLSEVFDAYLTPYVQGKREALEALMERLNQEEKLSSKSEGGPANSSPQTEYGVYESSLNMFEFIRTALKECTTFSRGYTYLSMSREFRICLQHYAENLKFRCPSPVSYNKRKPLYVISASEDQMMSRIVATGEYCINTVPNLELLMKSHIKPTLADEIDFSVQIDAFMDMVSHTYGIMTSGLCERLEPAMKTLRGTNVTSLDSVGDDSRYVKEIRGVLNETIPRVRARMSPPYFQGFCMNVVTKVLELLLENIWQLKCISKTGGGQLLLDLQGVKTYLLRMPNANLKEGAEPVNISMSYNSFVNTKSYLIERVLKVVCSDESHTDETFKELWPQGKPSDLAAIKTIKGSSNDVINLIKPMIDMKTTVKGGISNIMNTLQDVSTHSQDDGHGHGHGQQHHNTGSSAGASAAANATQAATKVIGGFKNAIGSFSFLGPAPTPAPASSRQNGGSQNQGQKKH